MSRAMIIGAGGVARVCAYKCVENSDVFSHLMIAKIGRASCRERV